MCAYNHSGHRTAISGASRRLTVPYNDMNDGHEPNRKGPCILLSILILGNGLFIPSPYLEQLVLANELGPGLKFQSRNLTQLANVVLVKEN